jgi:molybdopterin molybdotransferase
MISVKEALKIVKENAFAPSISEIPLLESLGLILAENIAADRDFPPFNRVAMDGIAIAPPAPNGGASESKLESNLYSPFGGRGAIESIQYAGEPQKTLQNSKNCMEVMTGAVLPLGCDTVIRYEDIDIQEVDGVKYAKITLPSNEIKIGQNVHPQGSDRKVGDLLLKKGLKISPPK